MLGSAKICCESPGLGGAEASDTPAGWAAGSELLAMTGGCPGL